MNKYKQNKAQVNSIVIWIVILLLLMFLSLYVISGKIEMFQGLIGMSD